MRSVWVAACPVSLPVTYLVSVGFPILPLVLDSVGAAGFSLGPPPTGFPLLRVFPVVGIPLSPPANGFPADLGIASVAFDRLCDLSL